MNYNVAFCYACGTHKSLEELEVYRYDSPAITDEPIRPLFALPVVDSNDTVPVRTGIICHECMHKIDPDMWIGKDDWDSLEAIVPFSLLPEAFEAVENKWDVRAYGPDTHRLEKLLAKNK